MAEPESLRPRGFDRIKEAVDLCGISACVESYGSRKSKADIEAGSPMSKLITCLPFLDYVVGDLAWLISATDVSLYAYPHGVGNNLIRTIQAVKICLDQLFWLIL